MESQTANRCACGRIAIFTGCPFDSSPLCLQCRAIYDSYMRPYFDKYQAAVKDYEFLWKGGR